MKSETLALKIKRHALDMVNATHASHIASILSVADIVAVLYADILHIRPSEPDWADRDRFILSKGHAGAAIYAALAECGFFPVQELARYYCDGSPYSGHISHKGVPGVEFSTGSLGHGCCVAAGMALAASRAGAPYRIYSILGDGECNEGSVWEMALFAKQYRLGNLTVIVDRNNMQAMGFCEEVLDTGDLAEKWRIFGWNVLEVADGHNHDQLRAALSAHPPENQPTCIIAHTIKGKGVSFMENNLLWHYRDPQGSFYQQAVRELEDSCNAQ